jgi:hypothetical protein
MAKLSVKDIQSAAVAIIREHPGGIRYSALVNAIHSRNPETPRNTIHGSVWNLDAVRPADVRKPSRGLYVAAQVEEIPEPARPRVREDEFYESFGEWLRNELDEVTDVVPLGGATFRAKWGTPDVLGVYKPLASNLVKFPLEIVAGEVKVAPSEAITAFGQAVAYRLFAANTHIVMPTGIPEDDLGRLHEVRWLRRFARGVRDADRLFVNIRADKKRSTLGHG